MTLPPAYLGNYYNFIINLKNLPCWNDKTQGYTFTIISGSFPSDITLTQLTPYSAEIHGTPHETGSFSPVIKISNACDECTNTSQPYNLTVTEPIYWNCLILTIDQSNLPNGSVGTYYSGSISGISGSGTYTYTLDVGNTPPGLKWIGDGTITGIPTIAGLYVFSITTRDSISGCQFKTILDINIRSGCVSFNWSSTNLIPCLVGVPYNAQISVDNNTPPYTYSYDGSLPDGVVLNPDGTLTGTPTTTGTFGFNVTATDSSNPPCSENTPVSITVYNCSDLITDTSNIVTGTQNLEYSGSIIVSGGSGNYTYEITAGSLPDGLTLNSDGTIVGIPASPEVWPFTITTTDIVTNCYVIDSLTITINPACQTFSWQSFYLLPCYIGTPYNSRVVASNGTFPFAYSVISGSLPDGLSMDGSGNITGTPTTKQTTYFTVGAVDQTGCAGTWDMSIIVTNIPIILDDILPDVAVNIYYSSAITATGGDGDPVTYTYSVTSGSLPPDLSLDGPSGNVTGTPTTVGTYNFEVTATDAFGDTGTRIYEIIVIGPCSFCFTSPVSMSWSSSGTCNLEGPTSGSGVMELQEISPGEVAFACQTFTDVWGQFSLFAQENCNGIYSGSFSLAQFDGKAFVESGWISLTCENGHPTGTYIFPITAQPLGGDQCGQITIAFQNL